MFNSSQRVSGGTHIKGSDSGKLSKTLAKKMTDYNRSILNNKSYPYIQNWDDKR